MNGIGSRYKLLKLLTGMTAMPCFSFLRKPKRTTYVQFKYDLTTGELFDAQSEDYFMAPVINVIQTPASVLIAVSK